MPEKEQYQPRSIASSTRQGARKQCRITGTPVGARVEDREDVVDRAGLAVGVAGVDDDRQVEVAGDLDLRLEGAALVVAAGRFAVVVDPGLADRPHLLVARRGGRSPRPRASSKPAASVGWQPTVAKTPSWRSAAAIAVALVSRIEADVEHPLHPRLARRRDHLGLGPLAEEEVRVGVDHRAQPIHGPRRRNGPRAAKERGP